MVRQQLVALMLMAAPLAQNRDDRSPDAPEDAVLVITWIDAEGIVSNPGGVARDLQDIFDPLHVLVRWRTYRGTHAPSRCEMEVHVHLKSAEPARWRLGDGAMGVVYIDVVADRRAYVFFPALARSLGYEPRALRRRLRAGRVAEFDRALARVIAHEVFHAVAPELAHTERGLMREHLRRGALVSAETDFDAASKDAFRRAWTSHAGQTPCPGRESESQDSAR